MSNVVNLRQARKTKARYEKEVVAEANKAKHGIAKSAHKKARMMATTQENRLEGHKLED